MNVRDRITVTFEAADPGEPALPIRFKRLLKVALRGYGLRNVGAVYDSDMFMGLANKLADASEVLSQAADKLDPKSRRTVAKKLRTVKADIDCELRQTA